MLNQLVGDMCGVPLSFVPHLLVPNRHTNVDNGEGKEGGGGFFQLPLLLQPSRLLSKQGLLKSSLFVIFSQLAGFSLCACVCQISINSTISYAVSLSTKVLLGLRGVLVIFYTTCVDRLPLFDRPENSVPLFYRVRLNLRSTS